MGKEFNLSWTPEEWAAFREAQDAIKHGNLEALTAMFMRGADERARQDAERISRLRDDREDADNDA